MNCENCNSELKENSKFCSECGEKEKPLKIKEDIGEQNIAELEKLVAILESKKKEEKEKKYPCPHCNKEITIQALKSKLNNGKSK